jgi:hypothetical protein
MSERKRRKANDIGVSVKQRCNREMEPNSHKAATYLDWCKAESSKSCGRWVVKVNRGICWIDRASPIDPHLDRTYL